MSPVNEMLSSHGGTACWPSLLWRGSCEALNAAGCRPSCVTATGAQKSAHGVREVSLPETLTSKNFCFLFYTFLYIGFFKNNKKIVFFFLPELESSQRSQNLRVGSASRGPSSSVRPRRRVDQALSPAASLWLQEAPSRRTHAEPLHPRYRLH